MTERVQTPSGTLSPRQRQVRDMVELGLPVRRIAHALGVSTQRVYAILRRLRELGELPDREETA